MAVFAAGWLTLSPPAWRYFGLRADAATVQPELGGRPAANAARIEQSGDRAKLIFELSAPLDATAFVLADPERVIVDLPQTDFALDPETGKAADPPHRKSGLIAAFDWAARARSRVLSSILVPLGWFGAACDKLDDGPHLVIGSPKQIA
jgi:N-acetylmuramoyl-L-alanine amidase